MQVLGCSARNATGCSVRSQCGCSWGQPRRQVSVSFDVQTHTHCDRDKALQTFMLVQQEWPLFKHLKKGGIQAGLGLPVRVIGEKWRTSED